MRHQPRTAMAGADDINHVQIVFFDQPVEMDINEVEPGGGTPMPKQTGFDVFELEWSLEEWIVLQINLPNRKVIRGAPIRVHFFQQIRRQRSRHQAFLIGSYTDKGPESRRWLLGREYRCHFTLSTFLRKRTDHLDPPPNDPDLHFRLQLRIGLISLCILRHDFRAKVGLKGRLQLYMRFSSPRPRLGSLSMTSSSGCSGFTFMRPITLPNGVRISVMMIGRCQ